MNPKDRRRAIQIRAVLHQQFPNCFVGRDEPKKPLKIGIHHDIAQALPHLSRRDISLALQHYTTRPSYYLAMVEDAARVDLNGAPAGEVDAGTANSYRARLASRLRADASRRVRAAAERLRPAPEHIRPEMADDEQIILLTTVGALRQLCAALEEVSQ